jgi:hypothetical protein
MKKAQRGEEMSEVKKKKRRRREMKAAEENFYS